MRWPLEGGSQSPGWAATAASGLLLGCIISLVETVQQPMSDAAFALIVAFVSSNAVVWSAQGVGWAFVARAAEPRLALGGLIGVATAATLAFSLLSLWFDRTTPILAGDGKLPIDARAAHVLWTNAFYGSLYMVAYVGSRRAVRSRRTLVRFQRARDESAALLEESRLEAFRRQLQPATVLDALDALRALYRNRPEDADDLLDLLVGFLRAAVRGLGGEIATLAGELDLAGRYLRLRALTAGGVGALFVETGRPAPEASFPPRLLTPVLEHLCASGRRVSLRAGWRGDVFAVTLGAEGVANDALPRLLRQRIATAFDRPGTPFNSHLIEGAGHLTWSLSFDLHAAAPRAL